MPAVITCPACGALEKQDIHIYNAALRKQQFALSPILPTCKRCGTEVVIEHTCDGGQIIVLNGTSGSGKSTVAEELAAQGFGAIDGDCVIQSVRHKTGKKAYAWPDLIVEIAREIDILSLFGAPIVLSHVLLPDDMDAYIEMFATRRLDAAFFLLRPDYATAVERCKTRTCHTSVTPEHWIKHFYDLLRFDDCMITVDNTQQTPRETAAFVLAHAGGAARYGVT